MPYPPSRFESSVELMNSGYGNRAKLNMLLDQQSLEALTGWMADGRTGVLMVSPDGLSYTPSETRPDGLQRRIDDPDAPWTPSTVTYTKVELRPTTATVTGE